jgi:hypothetical protein
MLGALVRAYRDARPVALRARGGRIAISPESAYRAMVAASEPFRLGTRFRAVPDVRLFVGDDLVRSPWLWLPGPEDCSLQDYAQRVGDPFQLLVTHPLVNEFALWTEVRGLLRGWFDQIGYPVLPVVAELVAGTFARTPRGFTKRLHHDVVTLVLAGELRTRLWDALWQSSPNEIRDFDAHRPTVVLSTRAGGVAYWPADRWHVDEALGPSLALRLWIPAASSRTSTVVQKVATELFAARAGAARGGAVPYVAARGVAPAAQARRTARRVAEIARSSELVRELAITWARRVSACGLEPVPPARRDGLVTGARVRRDPATPIVRMRWGREAIWAANGHAFALRDGERALRRVLAMLEDQDAEIDALCAGDRGLRLALEVLADARALVVIAPERGP